MPVSQISICNSALGKVGAARISDISQDTKSAILLNAIYEQVRDDVLRDHPWHFATTRVTLAPVVSTPVWGFDFAYDIPNDCLKIQGVDDDDINFILENSQILCDESTLNVKYTYRHTDESVWPADFAEAFAWRLAVELAYHLTGNVSLKQECEKSYDKKLSLARSMNGGEGVLEGLDATSWTNARKSNNSFRVDKL